MKWIPQPDDTPLAPFAEASYVKRDNVFADLFQKLTEFHTGDRTAGFADA